MKAVEILAFGDVQGVGYRRVVEKIARSFNVRGYVQNKLDGTVKILAEGESKKLNGFLQAIAIVEPPIRVEALQKKERRATGRYKTFAIRAGSIVQELQEGLGAGQEQLSLFRREFKDYREEFKDYRREFRDYRGEFKGFASRTDSNFKELGERYGEISAKLTQVLETLQKESAETRREMTRAIDNLSRLVDQYIQQQRGPQPSPQ